MTETAVMECDEETQTTLMDLARDACKHHCEPSVARALVKAILEADPGLRQELRDTLEDRAIDDAAYEVRHHLRIGVKYGSPCPRGADAIADAGLAYVPLDRGQGTSLPQARTRSPVPLPGGPPAR